MRDKKSMESMKAAEQVLGERELEVYRHLYISGPLTRNELNMIDGTYKPFDRRLSQLEARGCVAVIGIRICAKSGRRCAAYDVTGDPPGPVVKDHESKRPPSKTVLRAALEELKPILASAARDTMPATLELARWISAVAPKEMKT